MCNLTIWTVIRLSSWSKFSCHKINTLQELANILKFGVTHAQLCILDNVWTFYHKFLIIDFLDAARRFFQTKCDDRHLKENGKYDAKIVQQRRRNRLNRVSSCSAKSWWFILYSKLLEIGSSEVHFYEGEGSIFVFWWAIHPVENSSSTRFHV